MQVSSSRGMGRSPYFPSGTTCFVDDCDTLYSFRIDGKPWCNKHGKRLRIYGSVELPKRVVPEFKRCTICGELKSNKDDFYHNGRQGKRSKCKPCWIEQGREGYLKREYGITAEQYDRLLEAQDGRCAICRRLPEEERQLAVDHCHDSDRVRGLLCNRCNRGIGMLQDNPDVLRTAADYIEGNR